MSSLPSQIAKFLTPRRWNLSSNLLKYLAFRKGFVQFQMGEQAGLLLVDQQIEPPIRVVAYEPNVQMNADYIRKALSVAYEYRCELEQQGKLEVTKESAAYRLIHEGGDGFPALSFDVFARYGVLHSHSIHWAPFVDTIADTAISLGIVKGVYWKNNLRGGTVERWKPSTRLLRGESAPDGIARVVERDVTFEVRLNDPRSHGLFLDQRTNRQILADMLFNVQTNAASPLSTRNELRILNLFAHTCSFSVYLAAKAAKNAIRLCSTNIDIAKNALQHARRNFLLNGVETPDIGTVDADHRFLANDVFRLLPQLSNTPSERGQYDAVIVDPPSFCKQAAGIGQFATKSDYPQLVQLSLPYVHPDGGLLVCFANTRTVKEHDWLKQLGFTQQSESIIGCNSTVFPELSAVAMLSQAPDFRWRPYDSAADRVEKYLKGIVLRRKCS